MFTAVYLCYSPARPLWLAPFTPPPLQLQLNKTSNREAGPFCLPFSPRPLKRFLTEPKERRREVKNKMPTMHFLTFFFPVQLPIHSQFLPIYTSLSFRSDTAVDPFIYPPTETSSVESHPGSTSPPLSSSVSVSAEKRFLCHGGPLQPVSSRLWFQGLGRDHIQLKNIELFAFFSTLTMKQW